MFTINTAEIRWFVEGSIPSELKNWLKNLNGTYEEQNVRTDDYLFEKRSSSLGIKFREGRFEIKQLKQELGKWTCSEVVSGNAELWKKWSLAVDETNPVMDESTKENDWISIEKKRSIQKFTFSDQNKLIPAPAGIYSKIGCNVELTQVSANSYNGWTLGVETYGNDQPLQKYFKIVTDTIFESRNFKDLKKENSMSYPQWIVNLGKLDLL